MHQPALNRNIIGEVNTSNATGIRNGARPERNSLLRKEDKPKKNGRAERETQGKDAAPVFAHEQNKAEGKRGELNTARDADKRTPGNAGCRSYKIGKHQRKDDGVDLYQREPAPPWPGHNNDERESGDDAVCAESFLERDAVAAVGGIVIDKGCQPPCNTDADRIHDGDTHPRGQKSER